MGFQYHSSSHNNDNYNHSDNSKDVIKLQYIFHGPWKPMRGNVYYESY